MSLPSKTHPPLERALRLRLPTSSLSQSLLVAALSFTASTSVAEAQSWSDARTRPPLRHIVSVDATGEATWPYGREDIAGDGSIFSTDEAAVDVRSVYADADRDRVWLRAYVASESVPLESVVAFFFADTDDRDTTGGPALGEPLWPDWNSDPTPGGYERAVGVRGDGSLLGVWRWDENVDAWSVLRPSDEDVRVEVARDEDPIRIGARVRGYLQVDVVHPLSGLTASCEGNLFVRTYHDETAERAFGDDDAEVFDCRPRTDVYGDPVVIRSVACSSDDVCPNDGRCRDGVCLFAYACEDDRDCRTDERCTANACVRVVDEPCAQDADCDGLVCESGACVACRESGPQACGEGLACSPSGSCVDTSDFVPGETDGLDDADVGIVQGGAFHCATRATRESGGLALLALMSAAWLVGRRNKREGGAR